MSISRTRLLGGAAALFDALLPMRSYTKGRSNVHISTNAPVASETARIDELYALGIASEEHRFIARLAGQWNVVMHMFPGPGMTVSSVGMKSRKTLVLDGRQILEEIYEGSIAGVPHRKLTMLGYNAVNQRYEFVTADNLDTQQMTYRGTRDKITQTITIIAPYTQAVYAEMVSGDGLSRAAGKPTPHRAVTGMEMTVRAVLTIESDNRHRLQMFFHPAAGAETLGAEYIYDRT